MAEDRQTISKLPCAPSVSTSLRAKWRIRFDAALTLAERIGYPVLMRPSFTLGGSGAGIAREADELREVAERGLRASPTRQVLIEESVLGWKEYELEVMRDARGQFRRRLLDRKPRSDGRAHRRQHHRCARANAHRP